MSKFLQSFLGREEVPTPPPSSSYSAAITMLTELVAPVRSSLTAAYQHHVPHDLLQALAVRATDFAKDKSQGELVFLTSIVLAVLLFVILLPAYEALFGKEEEPEELSGELISRLRQEIDAGKGGSSMRMYRPGVGVVEVDVADMAQMTLLRGSSGGSSGSSRSVGSHGSGSMETIEESEEEEEEIEEEEVVREVAEQVVEDVSKAPPVSMEIVVDQNEATEESESEEEVEAVEEEEEAEAAEEVPATSVSTALELDGEAVEKEEEESEHVPPSPPAVEATEDEEQESERMPPSPPALVRSPRTPSTSIPRSMSTNALLINTSREEPLSETIQYYDFLSYLNSTASPSKVAILEEEEEIEEENEADFFAALKNTPPRKSYEEKQVERQERQRAKAATTVVVVRNDDEDDDVSVMSNTSASSQRSTSSVKRRLSQGGRKTLRKLKSAVW